MWLSVFDKHTSIWAEWMCVIFALHCVRTCVPVGDDERAHPSVCALRMWAACMCVWHRVEERRTGFISTCQQWVFKDMRPLDWGCFLLFCIFYLNSAGEIRKYLCRIQKRVALRQQSSIWLWKHQRRDRKDDGNEEQRRGHEEEEEEEECVRARRRQAAHAGL